MSNPEFYIQLLSPQLLLNYSITLISKSCKQELNRSKLTPILAKYFISESSCESEVMNVNIKREKNLFGSNKQKNSRELLSWVAREYFGDFYFSTDNMTVKILFSSTSFYSHSERVVSRKVTSGCKKLKALRIFKKKGNTV